MLEKRREGRSSKWKTLVDFRSAKVRVNRAGKHLTLGRGILFHHKVALPLMWRPLYPPWEIENCLNAPHFPPAIDLYSVFFFNHKSKRLPYNLFLNPMATLHASLIYGHDRQSILFYLTRLVEPSAGAN